MDCAGQWDPRLFGKAPSISCAWTGAISARMKDGLGEIARQTSTFALGVDHFGKSGRVDHFGKSAETGTRGSSGKEDNADVVLAVLGKKTAAGIVTDPPPIGASPTHRAQVDCAGQWDPRLFGKAGSASLRKGAVHFVCMDWRHLGDLIFDDFAHFSSKRITHRHIWDSSRFVSFICHTFGPTITRMALH